MKQAVISTGGKQYLVTEGQELDIELVAAAGKKLSFEPLLVIDGSKIAVGQPVVKTVSVTAEVIDPKVAGQKLRVIRYKAKKRVSKISGHRQKYTRVKITTIGK